jgi:ATP-dependent DNA helicase RecG
MDFVEHIGSGLKRIRESLRKGNLPDPIIDADASWFTVVFKRKGLEKEGVKGGEKEGVKGGEKEGVTRPFKTKERILEVLKRNPTSTIAELAVKISIGEKRIEKHISDLKAKGLLRRIGPDKGGHWEVE